MRKLRFTRFLPLFVVAMLTIILAACKPDLPILQVGSTNSKAITELQNDLCIQTDGVFGDQTRMSVLALQTAHGLPASGVVDTQTWSALRSDVSQNSAASQGLPADVDHCAILGALFTGTAVDANQTTAKLHLLKYDATQKKVVVALAKPASFGVTSCKRCLATPNGIFHVSRSLDPSDAFHRSNEFDDGSGKGSPMPWAVFFFNGFAIHQGILRGSYGCIHLESVNDMHFVHDSLKFGDVVVVHA